MEFDQIECGKRIKKLRIQKGMTQKVLANKLNISSKLLSDIERGHRKLTASDLAPLALFFSVTADYLMFGSHLAPTDMGYLQDVLQEASKLLTFALICLENYN